MKILFMGRKNIAAKTLEWLSTIPTVQVVGVLTDSHLKGSPTHKMAERLGYDVYTYDTALAAIRSGKMDFDLGISILYWKKLKGEFLVTPSLGIINFHPAPLPEYKGTGGYNFAILDGCTEWGVSAHYVDEGIDTGDIIEVSRFMMDNEEETCASLEKKSKEKLEILINKIITMLLAGEEIPRRPNIGGRYITRQQMEDAKRILPGDDVDRKIRAFWFPPYDGAYVEIDGQRFTLVSKAILATLGTVESENLIEIDYSFGASEDLEIERKIKPGDDVQKKIAMFWSPPYEGAYIEIGGERFTLVSNDLLIRMAPEGTTSLFTSQFTPLE